MALSDHGNYSGVVDIARNGIDEVIRLKAQAKADDALSLQLVEALEAMQSEAAARSCGLRICDEAIALGRARLEGKP